VASWQYYIVKIGMLLGLLPGFAIAALIAYRASNDKVESSVIVQAACGTGFGVWFLSLIPFSIGGYFYGLVRADQMKAPH
jgi:hypothetical protein